MMIRKSAPSAPGKKQRRTAVEIRFRRDRHDVSLQTTSTLPALLLATGYGTLRAFGATVGGGGEESLSPSGAKQKAELFKVLAPLFASTFLETSLHRIQIYICESARIELCRCKFLAVLYGILLLYECTKSGRKRYNASVNTCMIRC
jgi:hypothetical protein